MNESGVSKKKNKGEELIFESILVSILIQFRWHIEMHLASKVDDFFL